MNIAWLCKQTYMNHDVIHDQYGRLYNLPKELAQLGHVVYGCCLDYSPNHILSNFTSHQSYTFPLLNWYSYHAGPLGLNILRYAKALVTKLNADKPDIIIGGSDCLHSILTWWVAQGTEIPYILDLYDNFESFGMSRIPGMVSGHRYAIKNASGITTISNALRSNILQYAPNLPAITLNSTISQGTFAPQDKETARNNLGLPINKILIGTAGSLSASRGTGMLYTALDLVQKHHPETMLVLAGPTHGNTPPKRTDILYLGELPHSQIPAFFNSLDVAIICMTPNKFGMYAFPQKAYEILSCKVPVVAASVGPLRELFEEHPTSLYLPGDIEDLCKKIVLQINSRAAVALPIPTWEDQAKKLEHFITKQILKREVNCKPLIK